MGAIFKGTYTISNKTEITVGINSAVKPWNSIDKHTVQDLTEFVRWSSAFHHVFVFTVKERCVLFIDIIRVYLVEKNFLMQKYIFSCMPGTIR